MQNIFFYFPGKNVWFFAGVVWPFFLEKFVHFSADGDSAMFIPTK